MALAGRAAELQEYGEASSGISSDLAVATSIASQLVGQLGHGPGLLSLEAAGIPTAGNLVAKVLSDESSREAAEALMAEGADRAALMTSKYREALLRIADGLCESDELEGDQIKAIVAEYTDVTKHHGPVRIAPDRHTGSGTTLTPGHSNRDTGSDALEQGAVEQRRDALIGDVGSHLVVRRSSKSPAAASTTDGSRRASLVVLRNICGFDSTKRTARPMAAGSVSGSYQLKCGAFCRTICRGRST